MPTFDPSNWVDLLAYGIVAVPPTVAALAAWRKAKAAHYEMTNDHDSNIRHDIDDLGAEVREGFRELRKDIGGLRQELRIEREERIAGDRLRLVNGR
ncbi:minor tail protein [Mycobacterium phage Sheen]|uniref:Minor tail protein n=1 Tax=Mycobacterium phage Sheen TaxID=1589274 RepID=A0A0B5A3L9_9CAUD|nr:minor tail protein [Mycobacterium phage Sheen]AJD82449.1 minor tail protein [Mycobacterium phage Sheen]